MEIGKINGGKGGFNLWTINGHPYAATLVVRLLAGLVFVAEGIKKFMFATEWGMGRFETPRCDFCNYR
jgi:hypothetical protein